MSLDGVIEAPGGEATHPHSGWVFDFMGEEQGRWKLAEVKEAEALLIGRATYEGLSAAWPPRDGEFFPVVLGSGLRLFPDSPDKTVLKLVDTRVFPSGVAVHTYHRAA